MNTIKYFLTALLLSLALSGCTSMHSVEEPTNRENLLEHFDSGDLIHIVTLEGRVYKFRVKSISDKAVKGGLVEVPLDQIKTAKKKKISALKTTGAAYVGIMAGGLLLITLGAAGLI